jgi:adenylosuccinate lyase
MAASKSMKEGASRNDLLDRLSADRSLGLSAEHISAVADASQYVGRAPEQVDEFLSEVIAPILAGKEPAETHIQELRV